MSGAHPGAAAERLLVAAIETVAERGFERADEALIARRAALAPDEISRRFGSRERLFAAARARVEASAREVIAGAYASAPGPWRERLRAAMRAAAWWVIENPDSARWALRELERDPERVQRTLGPALGPYVEIVDDGRRELADPSLVPRAVAERVVATVVESGVRELRASDDPVEVLALVPRAMYLAVLPFQGREVAVEELRAGWQEHE